ncbi:MAG: hypothetical protein IT303_16360 [Dehalococcoidia bacterium]|nr:hypothetical protein [Dehalococcoidia bacterium]
MTKWGLTKHQITLRPWGIDEHWLEPEPEWLEPDKRITDPVHGKIYVNRLERAIIDSPPIQRLRRIRQLGMAHLVYPGATHTRFSHVLGTLRAAQDLLDAAVEHANGPDAVPDLFQTLAPLDRERCIAEATVLARLGGLLHDISHVPFGHTVEDDLRLLEPHDSNGPRFERFWGQLSGEVRAAISDELLAELRHLILSKEVSQTASRYPFVADIVGNTICADLLDYVRRDHHYTGLPLSIGMQFLDDFFVSGNDVANPEHQERMVIQTVRDGRERRDTISELLKIVRYRYEDDERVLVHHAKLAADAMLGKLIQLWADELWVERAIVGNPSLATEPSDNIDDFKQRAAETSGADFVASTTEKVTLELEEQFCRYGDDGLLERLSEFNRARMLPSRRAHAIARLGQGLLDRELYKLAARSDQESRPNRDSLYKRYRDPMSRRELEEGAARYAELTHRSHVVVWIPNPKMRMKSVAVLVGDGQGFISTLHDQETARGRQTAQAIYASHEQLWAVSVYVHPDVTEEQRQVLLAFLSSKLGVGWEGHARADLFMLAVDRVASESNMTHSEQTRLASSRQSDRTAAVSVEGTFADVVRSVGQLARPSGPSAASDEPKMPIEALQAVGQAAEEQDWRGSRPWFVHPRLGWLEADGDERLELIQRFGLESANEEQVNWLLHFSDVLEGQPLNDELVVSKSTVVDAILFRPDALWSAVPLAEPRLRGRRSKPGDAAVNHQTLVAEDAFRRILK